MQEKELAARISMFLERDVCDRGAMEDLLALCLGAEDTQFAHQLNKEVRRYNTLALREDPRGNPWLYELRKKSLLFDAPVEFEAYLQYVEWDREPKKRFYMPRRKVLLPVVHTLQDLMDDKLDLVTISMPPGTGKSTLGIFLLSWIMGRWPDSPNLASAHSGLLTRSFYDGVSQIIQDPEYLWKDVFPNAPFHSTNAKEETIDLVKPHRFSTLTCRAIGASLTGATRCEKLLYADDLVSGIEEAMNRERLDKLWLSIPTTSSPVRRTERRSCTSLLAGVCMIQSVGWSRNTVTVIEQGLLSSLLWMRTEKATSTTHTAWGVQQGILRGHDEELG
ncbi:MAG: hypothetical protein ACLR0P_09995 [Oscillospiraceae bacterium]